MERTPVISTNIVSVGWESGTLEVEFESGRVYQYFGVPELVYRDLMMSGSAGEYFGQFVKNRYRYDRIE